MFSSVLTLVVFFFGVWLIAEFRAKRATRITLGVFAFIGVAVAAYFAAGILPSYERQLHRASLKKLGEIAASGNSVRVQQALSTYNTTAGSDGSTYSAVMKMWNVVSSEPEPEPSKNE